MSVQDATSASDEAIQIRTRELLKAAESISLELIQQTEKLAAAIELFNREIVEPLRRELTSGDGDRRDWPRG